MISYRIPIVGHCDSVVNLDKGVDADAVRQLFDEVKHSDWVRMTLSAL